MPKGPKGEKRPANVIGAAVILFDYRVLGDRLWGRFNGGADGTRWYYNALADVFSDAMPGPLSDRLLRAAEAFSS